MGELKRIRIHMFVFLFVGKAEGGGVDEFERELMKFVKAFILNLLSGY